MDIGKSNSLPLKGAEFTPEQKAKQELYNKDWKELTIDEKVERMREQVKYRLHSVEIENRELKRKVSELSKHSHSTDGKVVIPFSEYSNSLSSSEMAGTMRDFF